MYKNNKQTKLLRSTIRAKINNKGNEVYMVVLKENRSINSARNAGKKRSKITLKFTASYFGCSMDIYVSRMNLDNLDMYNLSYK